MLLNLALPFLKINTGNLICGIPLPAWLNEIQINEKQIIHNKKDCFLFREFVIQDHNRAENPGTLSARNIDSLILLIQVEKLSLPFPKTKWVFIHFQYVICNIQSENNLKEMILIFF